MVLTHTPKTQLYLDPHRPPNLSVKISIQEAVWDTVKCVGV